MSSVFSGIILFLIVYFGYLVFWAAACIVSFSASLLAKRSIFINSLLGFNVVAMWLLSTAIYIVLIFFSVNLLLNGEWLWALVMFFFGIGLISSILNWLQMPFLLITGYFAELATKNLSTSGKHSSTIDRRSSFIKANKELEINRELAKYFLVAFGINLLSLFFNRSDYQNYGILDYITMPFIWVISSSIFIGFFVGIFNKMNNRKFFFPGRKAFLTTVLQIASLILGSFFVINLFL